MDILITGANRGLGLCLAKVGLENGHHIYAGVRSLDEKTTEPLAQLQETYKEKLEIVQLDVTDENSVIAATETIKRKNASLDGIINNAGILNEREKTIEELDLEACKLAFDINTLGPIRVIKHFLPLLEKGNKQSIINVSSEAGSLTNAYAGDYPYGLSKVAVNMLSEKLNVYLREKDIKVLSVHPGWMRTDMGGNKAPLDPMDTATGIFDMVERKKNVNNKYVFVDHHGRSMVI
ncbi:SDR family oxidoreductase [Aquibacillus albus]|uniref:NAD(P)-dependent dehydrogenase (Short-subunit alcohol dehydrogenase family) n=1 Tax=Aquibacillus albus TaxID=1168171 RepID=A0ABS2MW22_9BACI|nr:SDR family oxidoreductase [Aquibacillus albus]MBM7569978.1 NAD(P)-dependent dehydrogenase (short-subunit alcohol dehydrogenase family) [Aquibacillus albus]